MGGPGGMTNDGPKFHAVPFAYDASEVKQATTEGRSLFADLMARHDATIAEMRERELNQAASDALAFVQSCPGPAMPMRMDRMFETTDAAGEKVLFVMREPEMLVPMTIDLRWGTIWGPADARRGEVGRWGATATGRYVGRAAADRVLAGRYAERLPTNRKRKRARVKARRRARARGRME